jgi:hypothetical protein
VKLRTQSSLRGLALKPLAALWLGLLLVGPALADDDEGDPSEAISEAVAATRAEILKAATAKKAYLEGLEAYRQQQTLQLKAEELKDTLRQPGGICQTMETQTGVVAGQRAAQSKIYGGQKLVMQSLANNTNTMQTLDAANAVSGAKFCSPEEIDRGVCRAPVDPKYAELAGADQNAMYLFQSREGVNTYAGARDGAQVEAVNGYIARVVVGVPPEQLRTKGAAAYRQSPEARVYTEMLRRYNAFLSMSAYSLNQIKESRNPLK